MRFIIFATIFLTVFALLNLYIVKRFVNKLHIKNIYKKYIKLFLLFNFLGIVGYMFARYNPTIPNWLFFLLSLPIGVVFLIFCTAIFYDISHLAISKMALSRDRREFLKKTLDYSSLAVALGLSGRAIYEAKHIEIEKVDIKIKGLK
jgi:ABC-type transport system involved in multi-copper enzyme maturation permease subunit